MDSEEIRIDKFLWAVRLFKTRSQASEACRKGWIKVTNIEVKPSRVVKVGDIIDVKQNPIFRKIKVLKLLHNRVGAKLVTGFIEDITPTEELKKLELIKEGNAIIRDRGTGRPTKKQRRDIDQHLDW
jgi:ribosome-associated heat shock protein Hsp15